MKAYLLTILVFLISATSQAATLTFESGNAGSGVTCSTGSCFGSNEALYYVNISSYNGLIVDNVTTQSATGSHSGAPDGSESPGIDNPWEWFGNTGMFFTTSPASKTGGTGNSIMLDLSGLNITWNGDIIPRVEDELGLPNDPAVMTCMLTCDDGESYMLGYQMALPGECHPVFGDPSCFGAVYRYYDLTLRGTISGSDLSNVPLPGTMVLMISGIIGLAGFRRYRK